MERMIWADLLVRERFRSSSSEFVEPNRTGFQRDIDRLLFCGAFRRLQGKTQVHPLPKNDHIHNRLTHSLEVSSVGRTLGTSVGVGLKTRKELPDDFEPHEIGTIVQAASLAHDIGNPPFGHACEEAIGTWLRNWIEDNHEKIGNRLETEEITDLVMFDGNAQGFRTITRLEQNFHEGGLRLSYPTLATFLKYPWTPGNAPDNNPTKASAFSSETKYLQDVANKVGLIEKSAGNWCRSPLAHLVEAADDICYKIIDVEDGIELGILDFSDYRELIEHVDDNHSVTKDHYPPGAARRLFTSHRGRIFDKLISETTLAFFTHYDQIMRGEVDGDLAEISNGEVAKCLRHSSQLCRDRVFSDRKKAIVEIGVHRNVETTLGTFSDAVLEYVIAKENGKELSGISKKVVKHVKSEGFDMPDRLYDCLRGVVDYVAGMTDRYATYVAKRIGGDLD